MALVAFGWFYSISDASSWFGKILHGFSWISLVLCGFGVVLFDPWFSLVSMGPI